MSHDMVTVLFVCWRLINSNVFAAIETEEGEEDNDGRAEVTGSEGDVTPCAGCMNAIEDEFFSAVGQDWHPECFRFVIFYFRICSIVIC